MKYYLNALDGGEYAVYVDAVHGPRFVQMPDPAYVRRKREDGTDDPADMPPLVDGEPNADTLIPASAVEISDDTYRELAGASDKLVDVSAGKVLISKRPPRELTPQQLIDKFTGLIQRRLDVWAQGYGYDGILSMATYATSKVPRFAREGQAAVALRDDTWAAAGQVLADVQGGARSVPTADDLDAALPALPVL